MSEFAIPAVNVWTKQYATRQLQMLNYVRTKPPM